MVVWEITANDPVNLVDPLGLEVGLPGESSFWNPGSLGIPIQAGITFSAGATDFDSDFNKKGHSSTLLGASINVTIGDPGVAEVGIGMKNFGIGTNLDDGGIVGVTGHFGLSFPPSFGYGSVIDPSKNDEDDPCSQKK